MKKTTSEPPDDDTRTIFDEPEVTGQTPILLPMYTIFVLPREWDLDSQLTKNFVYSNMVKDYKKNKGIIKKCTIQTYMMH